MEVLKALDRVHPIPEELTVLLGNCIVEQTCRKGTHLLEIGERDKAMHFVVRGSGRVYYLYEGLEVTDYIAMDDQFLGGVMSAFTGLPSHKAIELMEDSLVQSMPVAELERLAREHHAIETLYRKMMTWAFLECQARVEDMRFLTAAQRYEALEKKYPGISNRIPLKHIASYLGTTQVSLSRIRAGIQ